MGERANEIWVEEGTRRHHGGLFRRLCRFAFHTAAASTLLLLAVLMLWPRSYFRHETMTYVSWTASSREIVSWAGHIGTYSEYVAFHPEGFDYVGYHQTFAEAWHDWSYLDRSNGDEDFHAYRCMGCEYWVAFGGKGTSPGHGVYVLYSYLVILSTIAPTFWLLTRKRRRHRELLAQRRCPLCGYDLRAHAAIPDARCPEFGTAVPALEPPR